MLQLLVDTTAKLKLELARFDAAALHADAAARILDAAVALERQAVSIRTLVADRAVCSRDFIRSGARNPEEWLANKTGSSYGEAAKNLATSAKLADLPAVGGALRNGELSAAKLAALGPTATPANEARLLEAARVENVRDLHKTCEREKAATRSNEEERRRAERIHRERYYRDWFDDEGAFRYEGKTTAAEGARIRAAIGAQADVEFKAAYAEGRRESAGAYRSDALVHLLTEGGAKVETTVVIRVDATKLAVGEGLSEVVGGGTVPVEEPVGAILAGHFVKVLSTDGVDVQRVAHPGRRRAAVLDTAIFERDDYRCQRPGCGATQRLEVHHYRSDYAKGGATAYWNLVTLCRFDHDLITTGGHRIEGGPGRWQWIPPP